MSWPSIDAILGVGVNVLSHGEKTGTRRIYNGLDDLSDAEATTLLLNAVPID